MSRAAQAVDSRDRQQHVLPAPPAAMAYLWSRTSALKGVWDVVQAVGAWPGVAITPNRSGLCFALGGTVLGCLRWNGLVDLPFAPDVRDRLVAEEMASGDPDQPDAHRVLFVIRTVTDVDRAVWLFRLAYLIVDPTVDACATDVAQQPGACLVGIKDQE